MIHFNLSHLSDKKNLYVSIGKDILPLTEHSQTSRKEAGQGHKVLSVLGEAVSNQFTHFVKINAKTFDQDAVTWIKVMRETPSHIHLDKTVLMAQYIPDRHLKAFYQKQFQIYRQNIPHSQSSYYSLTEGIPKVYSAKLHRLGLKELPENDDAAIELLIGTQTLIDSMETAASLVSFSPNLASAQPYTAARVMHRHILPEPSVNPLQYNAIQLLAKEIEKAGDDWSPVIECTDAYGKPMKAEYDLSDESGGFKKGQQMYTYGLADNVQGALVAPVGGASRTSANDIDLINKTWAPTSGKSVEITETTSHPTKEALPPSKGRDLLYNWTINEKTTHYGVSVDSKSIRVSNTDDFSVDCNNSYMRTLCAGYRLVDEHGNFGEVQKLYNVNATNDIMGIPIPTVPTKLRLNMERAAEIELVFGSLGVGEWDDAVSPTGAAFTGLFQYGIPSIFLIGGVLLKSTEAYRRIIEDKDLVKRLAIIFVSTGIISSGVDYGDNKNLRTLSAFANISVSIILQKGAEKLGLWVLKKVGGRALMNAAGPVAWVQRIAAITIGSIRLGVTTGQVLSSPATVRFRISRAIDVLMVLKPDPEHGEVGNPDSAVWPSVATRYLVTLQYIDGTNQQLSGPLEKITNNKPLNLRFKDVPAGGKFQIIAGVYSDSGWLAGAWQSDWFDSIPDIGTPSLNVGEHTIVENLVPLSPDTQYKYKEEINFVNGTYSWVVGKPSTTTVQALNGGNNGTLSELVSITLNNSAYQIGYVWRASGQNLHPNHLSNPKSGEQLYAAQNLSVLAKPGSRLISTKVGFTEPSQIAYAPSTTRGNEIDQNNFVLDPRNGEMNLRRVQLRITDGETTFGFENDEQLSWGKFPLHSIDALAVHPSNAVLACSFKDSRLMILNLPQKPSTDKNAPEAVIVSGEGIRQGLMKGPKAMAVAPNGNILILESENNRVQAFDIKGNPVPSFTYQPTLFELKTEAIQAELGEGKIPEVFYTELVDSYTTYLCQISSSLIPQLDTGILIPGGAVIKALSEQGIFLSYDDEEMEEPLANSTLRVDEQGVQWTITDPRGYVYRLVNDQTGIDVFGLPAFTQIEVQTPGRQWLIVDQRMGMAWKLTPSFANESNTLVKECFSYFPINAAKNHPTYLDMAVEAEGHIYILYYTGDGSKANNYCLDIYAPDGKLLIQSPDTKLVDEYQHIVAGRFDVDIWRNLYALTYAPMEGLKNTVQPGIMHWMPTPPLFSLPLSAQADLNDKNITAIVQDFTKYGHITLSNKAFIEVINPEGTWWVKDDNITYHIYRSGNELQVYLIKAN